MIPDSGLVTIFAATATGTLILATLVLHRQRGDCWAEAVQENYWGSES